MDKKELIPVANSPGLARCKKSGAIININNTEIEAARKRKALQKQESERLETLEEDVKDIKLLLAQLIEKLNG